VKSIVFTYFSAIISYSTTAANYLVQARNRGGQLGNSPFPEIFENILKEPKTF